MLARSLMRAASKRAAVPAFRAVSSRTFASSQGALKLSKALTKELEYERENYQTLQDSETFLQESGFEFKETNAGVDCYLSKTVDGKKVTIHFQSRQPIPEEELPSEGEEEENYFGGENFCDFSVFVEGKGESGLVFDCSTNDTEIVINNIQYGDDLEKITTQSRFERSYYNYAGPDFTSLDERLQTGLSEYLQAYGINEHLAAFVEVMSLDKDQRLYMQWLENMNDFVRD